MNSLQTSTFEYISTNILYLFQVVIWDSMVKIAPRCVTIARAFHVEQYLVDVTPKDALYLDFNIHIAKVSKYTTIKN